MKLRKVSKKVLALALTMVMAFALCACGSSSESKESTKEVTIGYFNNITHAQALYMKQSGSLEKSLAEVDKDITIDWQSFNAGPAEVEALFSGDIDIGYIGPVPAITANVKSNGDVVVLSGSTKGGAVLIQRQGAGITSVKDLDGKTVAIPQLGNTQHLCLLKLLSENGLKPVSDGGTVNVVAVENSDVANTMDRGDIDAALVPEPWGSTLISKGAELVLDYDQIYESGDYNVAVVVVRKEFMEENPDIVDAFLKAHEDATTYINDNNDDALTTINTELQEATGKSLDMDIIKEAFTRIGVTTELNKTTLMGFADTSKEQGFITDIPSEDDLFSK